MQQTWSGWSARSPLAGYPRKTTGLLPVPVGFLRVTRTERPFNAREPVGTNMRSARESEEERVGWDQANRLYTNGPGRFMYRPLIASAVRNVCARIVSVGFPEGFCGNDDPPSTNRLDICQCCSHG